ncbi:hypothetical protein MPPM_4748 [Methylorubrum populi]|jgi:hypothetical protein|uniref:Uncharacterized protein n=1 Tax=Methylorubrum populi TaxID=223967 RepID=A0A160PL22_9HYPH|nr:hypothetical protein [Methylorubrum populi]MRI57477.1 hypothetical protein [Methylobacterium sp. DB1607]BAU93353.1 hypothetical protein MPPM_4748 [Methylorubrum populi]
MTRLLLAALALACACFPALAAEAAEPVTWGALGAIFGWIGLGLIALVVGGIALAVIGGIILKAWSH